MFQMLKNDLGTSLSGRVDVLVIILVPVVAYVKFRGVLEFQRYLLVPSR